MRVILLTIFPKFFDSFLSSSLIGKAIEKKILSIEVINIRDFASPPHYQVDDIPYGGGPGMVMKPEPLVAAIEEAKKRLPEAKVILLSASGRSFTQKNALDLSKLTSLILVSCRYEGVDERVIEEAVDEELSIGDFVVMGGEVPSMVILESVVRLLPGVIGNSDSVTLESFTDPNLLEAPQYTRPEEFRGRSVPEVLLSGNHKKIEEWRKTSAITKTRKNRPDLKQ